MRTTLTGEFYHYERGTMPRKIDHDPWEVAECGAPDGFDFDRFAASAHGMEVDTGLSVIGWGEDELTAYGLHYTVYRRVFVMSSRLSGSYAYVLVLFAGDRCVAEFFCPSTLDLLACMGEHAGMVALARQEDWFTRAILSEPS